MRQGQTPWYDYMDNLRAMALLVGVFFHSAMAYNPMAHELWPAADPSKSTTLTALSLFTHMFRMPLFFLIAGFFACMLLDNRGVGGFIKHRSKRILLPFIIFFPLVIGCLYLAVTWAIAHVDNSPPFVNMVAQLLNNPDAMVNNETTIRTGHLWFLYNLFLFCIVAALLWKNRIVKLSWIQHRVSVPMLVFITPLLLIPSLSSVISPFPAPERLYPELWSFGFYGVFFFMGFLIYRRSDLISSLFRYVPFMLVSSLLIYSIFFINIRDEVMAMELLLNHSVSWSSVFMATLESYIAVFMTLSCVSLGSNYFNKQSNWLSAISRSSYWVYIIHLPVLLMIQYLLIDTHLGPWLKFWIGSIATLTVGFVSYLALVKNTPIGLLLNGKRAG